MSDLKPVPFGMTLDGEATTKNESVEWGQRRAGPVKGNCCRLWEKGAL